MIKLICFLTRKPGMEREAFHDHWLHSHGPLIQSLPEFTRHLIRYEQNHRLDADYERQDGGGYDGATVQWFEHARDFFAFAREPSYGETIAVDEARFLDPSKLLFILSELGHTVIDGDRSAA